MVYRLSTLPKWIQSFNVCYGSRINSISSMNKQFHTSSTPMKESSMVWRIKTTKSTKQRKSPQQACKYNINYY